MILFDRVNSRQADFEKKWLLHFWNEPDINGGLTSTEVAGHIENYDGDIVEAIEGNSKIFSKTLLPKNNNIRKVGGDGYEYWVDDNGEGVGENYPAPESNYGYEFAYFDGELEVKDAGKWRVEVSPTDENQFDNFFHVLYLGDDEDISMPETVLIEEIDAIGAVVGSRVIFFGKDGEIDQLGYEINPMTTTDNYIFDLVPGTYEVDIAGTVENIETSENGVLYFHDPNVDTHTVSIGGGVPFPKCSDGTLYDSCSADKPYFCDEGDLVEDCDTCGCDINNICESDGSCTEVVQCTEADDSPLDGIISLQELADYISAWKRGYENIEDLMNVIDKWKNEC